MRSRDTIRKAMAFEEGPIPVDFGGTSVTGIHCSIIEKLRAFYGLPQHPVKIIEPYQMLGEIEPDLGAILGVDTDSIWSEYNMFGTSQDSFREWRTEWGQVVLFPGGLTLRRDPDGAHYAFAAGNDAYPPSGHMPANGYFFDATRRDSGYTEDDYDWHSNIEEFSAIGERALVRYAEMAQGVNPDRWILGNFGGMAIGDISMVPAIQLEAPKGIRDIEEWYVSTLTRQEDLHRIFEYQSEVAIQNLARIAGVLGETVDTVYVCGTDFGTQNAPICAPSLYRELYLPYHKKINDWIHANTTWSTFKHSCGCVMPFIESFIEAGFDILNPVQWTAKGMSREELKARFHGRIVFWGGGVDTQKTLPFGTPAQVRAEVLETCRILGKGGGFVFNTIHNLQALTPVENVVAMIDAVKEYNKG